MDLVVVALVAAVACPIAVLHFYALTRPSHILAFFGFGKGADLDNAVTGLRLSMALALFAFALIAGAATAFLGRMTALGY